MDRAWVTIVGVVGAVAAHASLVGCQTSPDAPATQPRHEGKMETFTGTLESGVMAIGGESTGWRLVGDGQTGGIEVDVSRLRERAEKLAGTRVSVSGRMTERDHVERGRVRVLVAERIEPSPGSAAPMTKPQ
jgi:hypothetical protein